MFLMFYYSFVTGPQMMEFPDNRGFTVFVTRSALICKIFKIVKLREVNVTVNVKE